MTRQEMKQFLLDNGIPVQQVGRWQPRGLYVADFYSKLMKEPVQPAAHYEAEILRVLPGAQVVSTHDTLAHWREGEPVLWASVTFRVNGEGL